MYSVIIPTLWRAPEIHKLLSLLNQHELVGEIILIDNSENGADVSHLKKVVYIKEETNTFVNPAWNKAVSLAQYENLCITNDDLVFPMDLLGYMLRYINKGIIGQHSGNYDRVERGEYKIEKMNGREWGWGCLMFIQKSKWVNIPEDLLIACGDDYLLKNVEGGGWMIKNVNLEYQRISNTSLSGEFFPIQDKDLETFNNKYK